MAIHFKYCEVHCFKDCACVSVLTATEFAAPFCLLLCYKTLIILIYHFVDPPVAAPLGYQQSWWQRPYCEDDAAYRNSNCNIT